MAEPMHARVPARHPMNRRPHIPHPHLAPAAASRTDPPQSPEDTGGWTPVDVPLARPASRSRRDSGRPAQAERSLRSALHAGLFVNAAVLIASRVLPENAFGGWSYDGDDFLLAAAVLLSGYGLLAFGRISRRDDREGPEG